MISASRSAAHRRLDRAPRLRARGRRRRTGRVCAARNLAAAPSRVGANYSRSPVHALHGAAATTPARLVDRRGHTRRLHGYNGSGRAPAGRSLAQLKLGGANEIPAYGSLPVTVPGIIDGWFALIDPNLAIATPDPASPSSRDPVTPPI